MLLSKCAFTHNSVSFYNINAVVMGEIGGDE